MYCVSGSGSGPGDAAEEGEKDFVQTMNNGASAPGIRPGSVLRATSGATGREMSVR